MSDVKFRVGTEYTGRDSKVKPRCPFCGLPVERPREPEVHRPGEMPVGSCSCGAVYAYDATGHNLGSAFTEALVFACNMDWDLAWNLLPEEDYRESLLKNYDLESNYVIPVGSFEGRRVSGALYFVRMHGDVQEVTGEGVQKRLARTTPVAADQAPRKLGRRNFSRNDVEGWVREYKLEPLLETARQDKRVMRELQRLLYAGDELLRLKATDALGQAAGVIAEYDPGSVAKLLQKLFTSVTYADYGASNWGAIDAIGEIIRNAPELFAGYIPALYQFLADENLRPTVLRALVGIAGTGPDLIQKSAAFWLPYLQDANPASRGFTALLLTNLGPSLQEPGINEVRQALERLADDNSEISIYDNGTLVKKTVNRCLGLKG